MWMATIKGFLSSSASCRRVRLLELEVSHICSRLNAQHGDSSNGHRKPPAFEIGVATHEVVRSRWGFAQEIYIPVQLIDRV